MYSKEDAIRRYEEGNGAFVGRSVFISRVNNRYFVYSWNSGLNCYDRPFEAILTDEEFDEIRENNRNPFEI